MLACNHLGPQAALFRRFHQAKPRNLPVRDVRWQRHRMPEASRPVAAAAAIAGRRQPDQPGFVEFAQNSCTTRLLQPSASVAEPERLADPAGHSRTTVFRIDNRAQFHPSFVQSAPDLIQPVHEPVIDGRNVFV